MVDHCPDGHELFVADVEQDFRLFVHGVMYVKFVLAHLQLVAVEQGLPLDVPPVDVGAVEAALVGDHAGVVFATMVVAGDGDIVEKDVGVGLAPDGGVLLARP